MTKTDRAPTFDLSLAGDRQRKVMRMFCSDTRRALSSANSVVEALTDTTSALIEHAKDSAERNDDLSKTLALVIDERDRAIALADEAVASSEETTKVGIDWRDKAFDALGESEVLGSLLAEVEDDLTETAFNFGALLAEVQELLEVAPAGRAARYVEARERVAELVRAFDERDTELIATLLAKYEVVPEDETPDRDE